MPQIQPKWRLSSPFLPAGLGNGPLLCGLLKQHVVWSSTALKQSLSRYSTAQRSVKRHRGCWQHFIRGDVRWQTSLSSFALLLRQVSGMAARFTEGLEDEIRDEMYAHDLPEHLDELVDLAIRLDNRRDLRRRARASPLLPFVNPVSAFTGSDTPVPSSAPEPMQLGRYRLSPEEKQKRLSKGLCLYCGRPGHFASSCPAKANAR